ncbi:MAG: hypothetical protein HFG51_09760 [Lachnospiraceae bacterium]|nr:hypothetical protein [Lachnospiraceae bacterium]
MERKKRRREENRDFQPGHVVNSHMTVIQTDGELLKKKQGTNVFMIQG